VGTQGYKGENSMSSALPLGSMTIEEKLLAMEALWDDLCRLQPALEPLDWHRGIPEERERSFQAGSEELLDWEEAKRVVRERIA
jgi:hypothetical protein